MKTAQEWQRDFTRREYCDRVFADLVEEIREECRKEIIKELKSQTKTHTLNTKWISETDAVYLIEKTGR